MSRWRLAWLVPRAYAKRLGRSHPAIIRDWCGSRSRPAVDAIDQHPVSGLVLDRPDQRLVRDRLIAPSSRRRARCVDRVVLATRPAPRLGGQPRGHRATIWPPAIPGSRSSSSPTGRRSARAAGSPRPGRRVVAGYYLATSRVFIVDDYFFPIYVIAPRRGTTIIQTWHACGAFKKVGYSVLDKSFGVDEALASRVRIHSNYDVCLVASQAAAPHYAEAFRQPLERFVSRLGIPRTDVFFGEERLARTRDGGPPALRPARRPAGHPVRADVPRRQRHRRAARPTTSTSACSARRSARTTSCSSGSTRSSARGRSSGRTLAGFAIDVSDHPDINELMLVSDVLVTDYSSAIFEFALLDRPMVFFAPDYEAYERERGFYFDYRTGVPGPDLRDDRRRWPRTFGPGSSTLERVERFRDGVVRRRRWTFRNLRHGRAHPAVI